MKFNNFAEENSINHLNAEPQSSGRKKTFTLKFWFCFIPIFFLFLFFITNTIQHFQEKSFGKEIVSIQVHYLQEVPTLNETGNITVQKTWENIPGENSSNITTQKQIKKTSEASGANIITQSESEKRSKKSERPLVLYAYFERDSLKFNAKFFIQHGLHAGSDFIFIINGESDLDTLLPKASNIRVIRRPNTCFDLGAMGEVLLANDSALVKKYKKFILMNATIRGPFLPRWATGCWIDKFLNRINDEVKLVGMSHNCHPVRHVQSMILATDDVGIRILLNGTITPEEARFNKYAFYPESLAGLNYCPDTNYRSVCAEMSLSNLIHRAGYKVDVLMTEAATKDYFETCTHNNPTAAVLHYNYNMHPYETIFVKANKESYDNAVVDRLTEWHNDWNYTSWDACSPKV